MYWSLANGKTCHRVFRTNSFYTLWIGPYTALILSVGAVEQRLYCQEIRDVYYLNFRSAFGCIAE